MIIIAFLKTIQSYIKELKIGELFYASFKNSSNLFHQNIIIAQIEIPNMSKENKLIISAIKLRPKILPARTNRTNF